MYESDCTSLLTPSPCAKTIDGIVCSDSSSYWLDDVEGPIGNGSVVSHLVRTSPSSSSDFDACSSAGSVHHLFD